MVAPLKFAGGLGMMLSARQVGGAIGVAGFATILASGSTPGSISQFHHAFERGNGREHLLRDSGPDVGGCAPAVVGRRPGICSLSADVLSGAPAVRVSTAGVSRQPADIWTIDVDSLGER
ncbi:hypothetical protein GXW82_31200 [Streptacidiphilus sp. 4-A2]|nr:hypothetical protein [Streptacidiphilus sp. 4-A2]